MNSGSPIALLYSPLPRWPSQATIEPRLDVRIRCDVNNLIVVRGLDEEEDHEVDPRRIPIAHEEFLALEYIIHIRKLRSVFLVQHSLAKHSADRPREGPYHERGVDAQEM